MQVYKCFQQIEMALNEEKMCKESIKKYPIYICALRPRLGVDIRIKHCKECLHTDGKSKLFRSLLHDVQQNLNGLEMKTARIYE